MCINDLGCHVNKIFCSKGGNTMLKSILSVRTIEEYTEYAAELQFAEKSAAK
jgi:hypothetical protein